MKDNEFDALLRSAVRHRSHAPLPDDFNDKIILRLGAKKKLSIGWIAATAAAATILLAILPLAFNNRGETDAGINYVGKVEEEYHTRIDNAAAISESMRQEFNDISKHYEL